MKSLSSGAVYHIRGRFDKADWSEINKRFPEPESGDDIYLRNEWGRMRYQWDGESWKERGFYRT